MSEIRVNTIVAAEGTSAPNLPYGIQVPTGMGITGAGGVNISGVVTATSFDGTLIAGSAINSAGVSTVGILTVTKDARIGAAVTVDGAATVTGALTGSTGTFSGAVNIDATTDSTSTTTGALIVDGGAAIAKNVYIGAGLSVAGTLTYEDVTSVDSVGLITAKSGVNITGGQLQVGVAYSVGAAGVATALGFVAGTSGFTGDVTGDVTGTATNATHVYVTDNESTNENNLITFVENATSSTGNVGLEMDGNLTYNPSTGRLTATQLAGTLQTATQSNITEVGTLGALTVSGAGEFKVGTAVTISSTSGVGTFSKGVNVPDSQALRVGDGEDLLIQHNGTNSFIDNNTGDLYLQTTGSGDDILIQSADDIYLQPQGGEDGIQILGNGEIKIYYDGSKKWETTNDGVSITGMSTVTTGAHFQGMLREDCNIVANKLSAGTNIDLEDGMIHYYSTNETTTATPNIRWNSSYSLNNKMSTGETVTVSIIYKPNGAGYYASLNVDGSGGTEEWNGGSAPSSANAGGYDVLTHTLVKTGSGSFLCLSNVSNFA